MLSFMAEDEKTDAVREARATASVTSFPSFLSFFLSSRCYIYRETGRLICLRAGIHAVVNGAMDVTPSLAS